MLVLHDFRVRQRDFLLEISRAMTAQLDLSEVLRLVLNASVVMLSGEVGLIALRELSGEYRVRATVGVDDERLTELNERLQELVHGANDANEPMQVNAKLRQMAEWLNPQLQQSIALPLVMAREPLGLLIVFRQYKGNATPDDVQILQSFADQAAIAVHNAQLYARIDQERRRLAAILEHSGDGVMILDADLHILSFNRALERMTGWQSDDAVGLPLADVICWQHQEVGDIEASMRQGWPYAAPTDADEVVTDTTETREIVIGSDETTAGRTLYVEGDLLRRDEGIVSVGITYAPLFTRSGHLANIVANVRDITNFRQAQEMQKMFVSTVSHELRTPITLIKGYANTLTRDDVTWNPEVVKDSLVVIEEEADRLNALVDNLITASKIQAQRTLDINPSLTAVDEVAARAVERFSTQARDHQLVVDFPPGFPRVEADEVRIRQVIDNLISNAVKYTPSGGTVTVRGHHNASQITVAVQDTGIGMTQPEQERLFERFYRVDNALSRKTEGTGLGLYLSRAIIDAHGGSMYVDSQPGKGSTFTFTLPR